MTLLTLHRSPVEVQEVDENYQKEGLYVVPPERAVSDSKFDFCLYNSAWSPYRSRFHRNIDRMETKSINDKFSIYPRLVSAPWPRRCAFG